VFTGFLSAQIRATTDDGKRVILNADGTWEYSEVDSVKGDKAGEAEIDWPKVIRAHCEKEWKTDFRMLEYCFAQESERLKKRAAMLKNPPIPKAKLELIIRQCYAEWPKQPRMLHYCTEQQVTAFKRIN
jgi:hypothetical protein